MHVLMYKINMVLGFIWKILALTWLSNCISAFSLEACISINRPCQICSRLIEFYSNKNALIYSCYHFLKKIRCLG